MKSWALLFAIGFTACTPARVIPSDSGDCGRACDVLRAFECPEAQTTPGGGTCERVCKANRELLSISCVGAAKTVDEVRGCHVRCR